MVVWDFNAGVTVMLTMARYFVHIYLTRLLPSLLQGVLVLPFRLPSILLKVLNLILIHIQKHVSDLWDDFPAMIIQWYQTQHSNLPCYPFTSHCTACHWQYWRYLEESTDL